MEVKQFFKENIKPLISAKLEEIEEDFDLNELNSYKHHISFNYYEPDYDEYDEDEMYDACVEVLIDGLESDGVLCVFYKNLSDEARKELENAEPKEQDALDEMTIDYLRGKK